MKNFTKYKNPFTVIFIILLFSLGFGISKMEADFSYRNYYREGHKLLNTFDRFKKNFGDDSKIVLVISSKSGIFNKKSTELIQELTESFWLLPDIVRVDSLSNYIFLEADGDEILMDPFLEDVESDQFEIKKQKALNDKVLPDYLISRDAKSSMIIGTFKPRFNGTEDNSKTIFALRKLIKDYSYDNNEYEFHISGNGVVTQSFKEVSRSDLLLIVPVLLLIIIVLLWFSFKSLLGIVAPALVIISTLIMTFGICGYLGIRYSNILGAVPIILISISLADTIHILSTFYNNLTEDNKLSSANLSLHENFIPTILTTLTTAIGFFSLSGSELLPIAGLGIAAGAGTILAWINSYFWMIILLPLAKRTSSGFSHGISSVVIPKFTNLILTKRTHIIVITFLLSSVGLFLSLRNEVNADPMIYLSKKIPFRKATEFMDHHIGGASGIEIVIDTEIADGAKNPLITKKVDALVLWLEGNSNYSRVMSYTNTLKKINQSFHNNDKEYYKVAETQEEIAQHLLFYSIGLPQGKSLTDQLSLNYQKIRITGLWTLHDSKTILNEIDNVENKIVELGLKGHVSGKMPIYHNMNTKIVKTFFTSTLSALIGIIIILIFLFRSFKIGVLSLIPNIVPLFFGGAIMFLLNKPLDIGTVLIGAMCMGIAVDDTIHFLSHYGTNLKKHNSKQAIIMTMNQVGPALIKTTLIIICGFSSFLLADFIPNFNLGLGIIIVLFFALILDLLVLPALLLKK